MAVTGFIKRVPSRPVGYVYKTASSTRGSEATVAVEPGFYEVRAYTDGSFGAATITVSLTFVTPGGNIAVSTVDSDSAANNNASLGYVNLPTGATMITSNVNAIVMIVKIGSGVLK
jgi:hypothetical protein